MFIIILTVGLLHLDVAANWNQRRAFAGMMNRFCFADECDFPSGFGKALAPIQILAIHEKSFVEESYLIYGGLSCDEKAAVKSLDRACDFMSAV